MGKIGSRFVVFLGLLLFGLSAGAGGAMVAHWLDARRQPPEPRQQKAVMAKAGVQKVVRAERFEMVDAQGKVRAGLALRPDGVGLQRTTIEKRLALVVLK